MHRDVALFQQQQVQEVRECLGMDWGLHSSPPSSQTCQCFERILFIWSMRHPGSGYVQGMNDLVTPFFVVFLSYHICEFLVGQREEREGGGGCVGRGGGGCVGRGGGGCVGREGG